MEQLGRDGRITSKNAPPTVVTTGAAAGGTGVIIASACRFVVFGVAERATSTIAAAAAASGGSGIFSPLIFQPHNTLAGQGLDQQTPCQSTVLLSLQQEIYSSVRVGFAGQEESGCNLCVAIMLILLKGILKISASKREKMDCSKKQP